MPRQILLTQGFSALVDEEDFDFLNQWLWTPLAGSKTTYAARGVRLNGKYSKILMHRVIAERACILVAELEVDHKDRNGLNNQRYNLRAASDSLQQQNTSIRLDNTSGVKGVNFNITHNKWTARIQIGKSRLLLGSFDTYEQAVEARLKAERRFYHR